MFINLTLMDSDLNCKQFYKHVIDKYWLGGINMVNAMEIIIFGLVGAVLLGALLPDIADDFLSDTFNETNPNLTGASRSLANLVPVALLIAIVMAFFGLIGIKISAGG